MGFNTIRKHIKVEPARWYYHADKLGMLVWQDFVNPNQSLPEGSQNPHFEKQLNETLAQLHNYPSITSWVLFNERWGRYDQKRLTEYVKKQDPSRLLNAHSGEMLWVNEQLRDPAPNAWESSDIARRTFLSRSDECSSKRRTRADIRRIWWYRCIYSRSPVAQ